jgi:hypothetical protein
LSQLFAASCENFKTWQFEHEPFGEKNIEKEDYHFDSWRSIIDFSGLQPNDFAVTFRTVRRPDRRKRHGQ